MVRTPARGALRRLATLVLTLTTSLGLVAGAAGAASADAGVDVSKWQHSTSLDWSAVRADGISFAFIKATEGSSYTNPYFAGDWAASGSAGILHGAYHFARPSIGTAAAQARYFVSRAGTAGQPGDLPPVLDLEATGGLKVMALRNWTANWLQTVQELTGRAPIVYTSPYFWETYLGNSTAFTQYPLWVAHYGVSQPRVPGGWTTWTFWQSTSDGHVDGIGGRVDMNTFNGTTAQLSALANGAPAAPETAPTTPGSTPTGPTAPADPGTAEPATTDPGTTDPDTTDPGTTDPGSTDRESPARADTVTTLAAGRGQVFPGSTVTLSGSLTTTAGAVMPNRRIAVLRRDAGSGTWTRVAVTRTDATGSFRTTETITAAATFRARFPGALRFDRSLSPLVQVTLRPRTVTAVDAHTDRAAVLPGRRVKVYGHLTTAAGRALAGHTVTVYQRPAGTRRWTPVGDGTSLAPTGWYQLYVRPAGRTSYKAVFAGDARRTAATSTTVTVTTR
jgi:GH25 family lysozyme M1 (1,4-beta-N-acetylmuramidase)